MDTDCERGDFCGPSKQARLQRLEADEDVQVAGAGAGASAGAASASGRRAVSDPVLTADDSDAESEFSDDDIEGITIKDGYVDAETNEVRYFGGVQWECAAW